MGKCINLPFSFLAIEVYKPAIFLHFNCQEGRWQVYTLQLPGRKMAGLYTSIGRKEDGRFIHFNCQEGRWQVYTLQLAGRKMAGLYTSIARKEDGRFIHFN